MPASRGCAGGTGSMLISSESGLLYFLLRMDARNFPALSLRPVDVARLEAAAAGLAGESGRDRALDCFPVAGEARMSLPFILFFVFALIWVGGAILLIMAREPIHSALALILVMMSLAGLYLMLGAEFIAAVQIIVYAGAIMVLFVFVIMLLNAGTEERTDWSKIAKYAGL